MDIFLANLRHCVIAGNFENNMFDNMLQKEIEHLNFYVTRIDEDFSSAKNIFEKHIPLAIIHYEFCDGRGAELVEYACQLNGTKVIAIANKFSEKKLLRMLDAGARAFFAFKSDLNNFHNSIQTVLSGEYYFNKCLTRELYDYWFDNKRNVNASWRNPLSHDQSQFLLLSKAGRTYQEISGKTCLNYETVKNIAKKIFRKFKCHDVKSAIKIAEDNELILYLFPLLFI